MKVDYEVRKLNNGEILQLIMKTVDLTENVSVSQTIYKEDFIKAGNIIDKTTLPFKLCYILLKKFQEKINNEIVRASQFVIDLDLQTKMIDYARDIINSKAEIVSVDLFESLLKEVEEYEREIRKA